MKERPILFNAEMVRAILDGRKTQTRRPVKSQPAYAFAMLNQDFTPRGDFFLSDPVFERIGRSGNYAPHGKPGDRLWVRESFQPLLSDAIGAEPDPSEYDYKTGRGYCVSYPATDGVQEFYNMGTDDAFCSHINPSIHMPRWASRITLEITDVCVQRVQEISEEDAVAEGPIPDAIAFSSPVGMRLPVRGQFARFWNSIHGPGAWERNDWVWAYTFQRVQP